MLCKDTENIWVWRSSALLGTNEEDICLELPAELSTYLPLLFQQGYVAMRHPALAAVIFNWMKKG